MSSESIKIILLVFLLYSLPFIYFKLLVKYILTKDGIDISVFGFHQDLVKYSEILAISLNEKKISTISRHTSFPDPRRILPIMSIYITLNRKFNFGFGEKYKGIVIYPRDTLNFYREIKQKIKTLEQEV